MISMPGPPQLSPAASSPSAPSPRDRKQVLGCLAVAVVVGLVLITWLGGWWAGSRTEDRAERARVHHLRRVGEDQLRSRVSGGAEGQGRAGVVSPERMQAAEVLAGRSRDLHAAGDWAGVIQCIGLLEDFPADDPELDVLLETALFNQARQLLQQGQAVLALEYLHQLLSRTPTDLEADELRSIGLTIRDYGLDQRSKTALERFKERR